MKHAKLKLKYIIILALILGGCRDTKPGDDAIPAVVPTYKPVGEYKGIKLGSSFEDVIGITDSGLFNPYSLKDCFRDIALRGCDLSRKSDETVFDMREGVPYALALDFNRKDKLTDIGLNYRREDITGQQCREILATTIDWVVKDYGPLSFKRSGQKWDAKTTSGNIVARTPNGTSYAYLKPDENGSYVTQFLHLASQTTERKRVEGENQVFATGRGVSIFSTFIVIDQKAFCDINLQFREPDSVERSVIAPSKIDG